MVSRRKLASAVAAGAAVVAITVAVFGDIPYRLQDGKTINIGGEVVCLPHKQGLFSGPQTLECAFGFKGIDGRHYVISNFGELAENEPLLIESVSTGEKFVLSGVFTYGAAKEYEKYDVVGTISVDLVGIP
jgi:hypothetical protein